MNLVIQSVQGVLMPRSDFAGIPEGALTWSDVGPLLDRERIAVEPTDPMHAETDCAWMAWYGDKEKAELTAADTSYGPTPLIAAIRCYRQALACG